MVPRTDLTLYDRHGRLVAVAEIKNKSGTSREWAAQYRRNILAHGGFRGVDFFLLITPDRVYLWKDASGEPTLAAPAFELDVRPFLQPYFTSSGVGAVDLSSFAFELAVTAWLSDLIHSHGTTEELAGQQNGLGQSGFVDAVTGGRVEYEVAA